MMAFERTPSLPNLEPETVEKLRAVLTRSVQQGNHSDELRDLLCDAAAEARGKGIHAERLLVILKDIWHSLHDVANAPAPDVERALLQQLISRCIREYYSK
jgi:hypothetical protein